VDQLADTGEMEGYNLNEQLVALGPAGEVSQVSSTLPGSVGDKRQRRDITTILAGWGLHV